MPKSRNRKPPASKSLSVGDNVVMKQRKRLNKKQHPILLSSSTEASRVQQWDDSRVAEAGKTAQKDLNGLSFATSSCLPTSLFFPFEVQHSLLSHLQEILEQVCEQFGNRWCPKLMSDRKWTHPKALELNCWSRAILNYSDKLPPEAWAIVPGKNFEEVLRGVTQIRHLAVHRQPQDATSLLRWIEAAKDFTRLHQDTIVLQHISNLEMTVRGLMLKLQAQQQSLQNELQERLEEIAQQKAILAQQACDNVRSQMNASLRESGDHLTACLTLESQSTITSMPPLLHVDDFSDDSDIDDILLSAEKKSSCI